MLISKVTLYTSDLNETKDFYVSHLGFNLLTEYQNGFELEIGDSVLEFQQTKAEEKPFYHFAFNIPSNLFAEAKDWAKSKVTLNQENGEDEAFFDFFDSHSLYFMDPPGNIVELISRHSVSPPKEVKTFTAEDLLNISEINITTNNVLAAGSQINHFGIPVMNDEVLESDRLNFIGESEDGAFLLLGPEKRPWIFSDRDASIYSLSIEIDNHKNIQVDRKGDISLEKN